jgi:hypothetical protein
MDYVYICRAGENEKLRYSIRSVIQNGKPDNIWLIGSKPDWYTGNFIEVTDIGNKYQNITNCYNTIINSTDISEDFVLMNDDFFILKPMEFIPTYNGGLLQEKILDHTKQYGLNKYATVLQEVNKQLLKNGIKVPLNYDIHVPMVFNKTKLKKFNDISLAPRSLYGNAVGIGGKTIEDPKIYDAASKFITLDTEFVSTIDNTFILIKDKLNKMFPNKSEYEIAPTIAGRFLKIFKK